MPTRKSTRNAQGSGSIRQRPDGKWEGRYTLGRDPGTGKQIQKSIYGATQREVLDKLTAIRAGLNSGTYTEPSKLTVAQWLDIWSAEYLNGVKPSTKSSYITASNIHLIPALGAVKLQSLSAHMIQTLYNRLQKGTDDKKSLSAKSIKNIHGILHKAIQQAVKLGYLRSNPADAVELPRLDMRKIQPLDDEAIAAFVDVISGHKWEAVYLVTLFTGMRQGEVLGLTWPCVDFERGTILIERQLLKNRLTGVNELVTPKNSKSRCITPAPSVMAILREQQRRQTEMRLRAGSGWVNKGLVFTDGLGGFLSAHAVYNNYKMLVGKIGVPSSRFHDLRHTYAVSALSSGDDIKTLQENLGHHTASFTLDVYGHVSERMKQESAARMETFIRGVKRSG